MCTCVCARMHVRAHTHTVDDFKSLLFSSFFFGGGGGRKENRRK
jgi:hypothetical protein